jgi:hypothetical protein
MSDHPVPIPTEIVLYVDQVFAPLDRDHQLERIGGGFETEVYRSDDKRWVVKLKHEDGDDLATTVRHVRRIRAVADAFVKCLGPKHSVPSHYVVSRDAAGRIQALVVQPFLEGAQPLYTLSYARLADDERHDIARQLRGIIDDTLEFYRRTRFMPDLYGLTSAGADERRGLRDPRRFPQLLWDFLVRRNLLRSHNLLLTTEGNVVLVDYDLVRWPWIVRRVYFAVRQVLHWRDRMLIERMLRLPHPRPRRYIIPRPLAAPLRRRRAG